ncbi:hypothetical protein NDN08_005721 [Rhodosorus marinus]|uniref:CDP-diacylglycerol--inositol 3-phosphatidyltransferase n=1 Tax=Rhodosorus marinus TaxID=101924 RepID=A0AAV8V4V5_9RHOD|nr:hypothetical protein NDN08_005721 [Rhodosorus marinus]
MANKLPVWLWVPNVIGYLRIVLVVLALSRYGIERKVGFWVCYGLSFILDGFDGMAARRLNQTSEFGAFLDVTIDIASRGVLSCQAYQVLGPLVLVLEGLVFTVNHRLGKNWKIVVIENSPWVVREIFRNGFRTPLGALAISGLFLMPVYGVVSVQMPKLAGMMAWKIAGVLIFACRALCGVAELFCLWRHCAYLISLTANSG